MSHISHSFANWTRLRRKSMRNERGKKSHTAQTVNNEIQIPQHQQLLETRHSFLWIRICYFFFLLLPLLSLFRYVRAMWCVFARCYFSNFCVNFSVDFFFYFQNFLIKIFRDISWRNFFRRFKVTLKGTKGEKKVQVDLSKN